MKTKNFTVIVLFAVTMFYGCNSNKSNTEEQSSVKQFDQTYPTLVLLSSGLTTDTLKSAFLNILEREPKTYSVAVVVNASTTEKKKYKKTKKVKIRFSDMGFDSTKIKLFDLMKRTPQELSDFDIIYALGGNPFLLLDEVNKSGFGQILADLAHQNKIMMGYSAVSLLLGPDMTLMDSADSLLGFNYIGLKELNCLGLYDFYIFPHYADFTSQATDLVPLINRFEKQTDFPLYRLNDDQGIIYQDGKIEVVGY